LFDAILNRAPVSPLRLNPELPIELERIINKALEKDLAIRYQSAKDILVDLKRLKRDTSDQAMLVSMPTRHKGVLRRKWKLSMAGVLIALLGSLFATWLTRRTPHLTPELKQRRLTANPADNPVEAPLLSPDGKYLAYCDRGGLHLQVTQTGENHKILQSEISAEFTPIAWFPDGARLLLNRLQRPDIWVVSVFGGTKRKLSDDALAFSVSPDGSLIAFTRRDSHEIWLMGAGGESPRKIVSAGEREAFGHVFWSPNGQRIGYVKGRSEDANSNFSLESCDLNGGEAILILSDKKLLPSRGVCWLPSGRIIYDVSELPPNEFDSNLWEIGADPKTGHPIGKPQRITNWVGSVLWALSSTTDGKRLAFVKINRQRDVYIGELTAKETRLKTPQRLTLDEREDIPMGWTPDSKAVLFCSNRNGSWDIFTQSREQESPEPLVTGPEQETSATVTQDGSGVLYVASPSQDLLSTRIMRVPISGGPPQLVLAERGISNIRCGRLPNTLCVFSRTDKKQVVFFAFDPVLGNPHELTRLEIDPTGSYDWALSPDSSQIALAKFDWNDGCIRVLSLGGKTVRDLRVDGRSLLAGLNWSNDGRSLFVSSWEPKSVALLHVDLKGKVEVLWQPQPGHQLRSSIPSPDGRYLAIADEILDSNAWMLENF
jgi:Tol biopolymer transport system component